MGSDSPSLADGGAVQNGRERRPGRKNIEGEGRWMFVLVRSDGPWMMVATFRGRSVELLLLLLLENDLDDGHLFVSDLDAMAVGLK